MKLAIDAMGGDHAPEEIVLGAMEAVEEYPHLHITLVGDEDQIKEYLTEHHQISIVHTTEYITGEDEPVRAIRRKKNSSLVLMAEMVKEGKANACLSAGNTGALMSAGLFIVGRIKGIERPALGPTLPTLNGQGCLMLDVGANVDATVSHLLQHAMMGSIYAEKVRGRLQPKVGLLNVGTEDNKGNDVTKRAHQALRETSLNFVGNVEARDLFDGEVDVVVTDGFSGNIALKTIEGTAIMMFSLLKETFMSSFKTRAAALLMKKDLKGLQKRLDYSEYGGALLFGLAAPVIKAHGSSNRRAIYNAIQQAHYMVENNVVETIQQTVNQMSEKKES